MIDKLKKISATAGTAGLGFFLSAGSVLADDQFLTDFGGDINPSAGYATSVGGVINSVLSFVMLIAALLVLFYLIWGGIEWITSGGDKGKTESARNKITSAVVGMIVLAAAYAIFLLTINFLGFSGTEDLLKNVKQLDTTTNDVNNRNPS